MADQPDDGDDPWTNAGPGSDDEGGSDGDSDPTRLVVVLAALVLGGILLVGLVIVSAAVVGSFVLGLGQNVEESPSVGVAFEETTTDGSADVVVTLTSVRGADRVSVDCAGSGFEDLGGTEVGTTFSCVADHDGLTGGLADGDRVTVRATDDGATIVVEEYIYTG